MWKLRDGDDKGQFQWAIMATDEPSTSVHSATHALTKDGGRCKAGSVGSPYLGIEAEEQSTIGSLQKYEVIEQR